MRQTGALSRSQTSALSGAAPRYLDSYKVRAYAKRSEIARWAGDPAGSREPIDHGLAIDSSSGILRYEESQLFHGQGLAEESIQAALKALTAEPENRKYLTHLASLLLMKRDRQRLRQIYKKLVSNNARLDGADSVVVDVLLFLGENDALVTFLRGKDLARFDVSALHQLSIVLQGVGQSEEAVKVLAHAAARDPSNAPVLHALSLALESLGDYDGALIYAQRAAFHLPSNRGLTERFDTLSKQQMTVGV